MECIKCGSSWNVAGNLADKITKCPFCGSDLYEMTIESQMKLLVKQHGIALLNDEMKINGILVDMFPQNNKERAAVKTALSIGVGGMFFDLAQGHETKEKKVEKLKTIRQRLADEAWMSDTAIDYICKVFLSAIENEALTDFDLGNKNRILHKQENVTASYAKETASKPDTLSVQEDLVEKDINKILTAAMNNDTDAQYHMGCLYYTGTEVRKDYDKARSLFLSAAEKGNANAQNSLGIMYEDSLDVTSAMKWYKKAADNGNQDAAANYDRLRSRYPVAALAADV